MKMVWFNCNIPNFTEILNYMYILNNNVFNCKIIGTQQCDKYFIFPEKNYHTKERRGQC